VRRRRPAPDAPPAPRLDLFLVETRRGRRGLFVARAEAVVVAAPWPIGWTIGLPLERVRRYFARKGTPLEPAAWWNGPADEDLAAAAD
jgi:hypothetical protein